MEDMKQDMLEQNTVQGAAAFLRILADGLEGRTGGTALSPVAGFRKLKITLSRFLTSCAPPAFGPLITGDNP